jgi:hypothetical protein
MLIHDFEELRKAASLVCRVPTPDTFIIIGYLEI